MERRDSRIRTPTTPQAGRGAGSGADAAPYFRIFNPVTQGETFDPDGVYGRRWVPELAKLPNTVIHAPWQASAAVLAEAQVTTIGKTDPAPIVDHGEARREALAAFAALKENSPRPDLVNEPQTAGRVFRALTIR